jgi:hypothetical protein
MKHQGGMAGFLQRKINIGGAKHRSREPENTPINAIAAQESSDLRSLKSVPHHGRRLLHTTQCTVRHYIPFFGKGWKRRVMKRRRRMLLLNQEGGGSESICTGSSYWERPYKYI